MAESAWIKRYRIGSYNGIEFYTDGYTGKAGRKKVVHSFPGRDDVEVEDLGKFSRQYTLNIYILSDDYFIDRNKLILEVENNDRGVLIHPYFGEIQAQILDFSFRETWDEGRMVKFTMDCIEDAETQLTTEVVDTKTDVYDKRDSFYSEIVSFFDTVYTVTEAGYSVSQKLITSLDAAINIIDASKKAVQDIAGYKNELDRIKARLQFLVFSAEDLASETQSLLKFGTDARDDSIEGIEDLTNSVNSREQFLELKKVADNLNVGLDVENDTSKIDMLQLYSSVAGMAGLCATIEYDSIEDAEEVTNILFDFINQIEEDENVSQEMKNNIRDVRESVYNDAVVRINNTGILYEYDVNEYSKPSIEIVNSIYGDIDKEQEILDRNNIQDPFFVSGIVKAVVDNE